VWPDRQPAGAHESLRDRALGADEGVVDVQHEVLE
jgi:hypothetical protein